MTTSTDLVPYRPPVPAVAERPLALVDRPSPLPADSRSRWTPLVYGFGLSAALTALVAVWAEWSGHEGVYGWLMVAAGVLLTLAFVSLAEESGRSRTR